MSEIVEYDIKPEPTTSLSHMIEFGLQKHLEKYVLYQLGSYMSFWTSTSQLFLAMPLN